jgi:hypothetical protein
VSEWRCGGLCEAVRRDVVAGCAVQDLNSAVTTRGMDLENINIRTPPQPHDAGGGGDDDGDMASSDGSPSIGPQPIEIDAQSMTPFPSFPAVLPRPPLSASTARSVDGRETKVDGKWLEDAWRTVRGMEGSWQRHREARSDAINCALQQADTIIAEVNRRLCIRPS